MLEARSHELLKILLKEVSSSWQHDLTLCRLVGRSLRRKERTLIQIDLDSKDLFWLGLLIPLCLETSDAVIVLSKEQKSNLLEKEIPILNQNGFDLIFDEGRNPPKDKKIWIIDYKSLLYAYKNNLLKSKQLIIPYAEDFSKNLREVMSIEIETKDWNQLIEKNPNQKDKLLRFRNNITKSLFQEQPIKVSDKKLNINKINDLKKLCSVSSIASDLWNTFSSINTEQWSSWAKLKHKELDWNWNLVPLEPLIILKKKIKKTPFIFIESSAIKKSTLKKELDIIACKLHATVRLNSKTKEEPIAIFAPNKQPLPNSEIYKQHLLEQSKRLIIGISGITILLIDDEGLLLQIASELAAEFGKRVLYEQINTPPNGIIFCKSSWWLNNYQKIPIPKQLIIGLLPIASLSAPLTATRVEALKKQGYDWFRELLLPEAINIITKSINPIRNCSSRVAILDGRLRSRSWGNDVLKALIPWTPLNRLLPG